MKLRFRHSAFALAAVFGMASQASAIAIYTYTGNNFDTIGDSFPPSGSYTTADSVSGSITMANPIGPNQTGVSLNPNLISYSFTDGRTAITDASPTSTESFQSIDTDASGNIIGWRIELRIFPVNPSAMRFRILTFNSGAVDDLGNILQSSTGPTDFGSVSGNAGTWSLAVPEPGTSLLLATGLAMLAGRVRRRG